MHSIFNLRNFDWHFPCQIFSLLFLFTQHGHRIFVANIEERIRLPSSWNETSSISPHRHRHIFFFLFLFFVNEKVDLIRDFNAHLFLLSFSCSSFTNRDEAAELLSSFSFPFLSNDIHHRFRKHFYWTNNQRHWSVRSMEEERFRVIAFPLWNETCAQIEREKSTDERGKNHCSFKVGFDQERSPHIDRKRRVTSIENDMLIPSHRSHWSGIVNDERMKKQKETKAKEKILFHLPLLLMMMAMAMCAKRNPIDWEIIDFRMTKNSRRKRCGTRWNGDMLSNTRSTEFGQWRWTATKRQTI